MGSADSPWPRVGRDARWSAARSVARELVYVVIFLALYEFIRGRVVQSGDVATRSALRIVDVERALGIFHERAIQSLFVRSEGLIRSFNLYYGGTHFLVPAVILIWIAVRHSEHYPKARTLLAVTTAAGFLFFWRWPVAPPRLLPAGFGIVDTIHDLGGTRIQADLMDRAGNAYAALPSLHMAWAVWVTIVVYPRLRHRWARVIAVVYPLMTALVVVATGNHFIADCVAGTILIFAVAWVLEHAPAAVATRTRWRESPVPAAARSGAVDAVAVPSEIGPPRT